MHTKSVVPQLHCLRCGYLWAPRTGKPKKCPKCLSPKWETKRTHTKRLGTLVSQVTPENRYPEISAGTEVGREAVHWADLSQYSGFAEATMGMAFGMHRELDEIKRLLDQNEDDAALVAMRKFFAPIKLAGGTK